MTLAGKMSPEKALAAIRIQTGIEVRPTPSPKASTVDLNLMRQPFWVALEEIARQTDAHIVVSNRGATIGLAPGKETRASSIDGPFRTIPKQVRLTRELIDGRSQYLLISEIHWEPKFPVFRLDDAPANAIGTDDLETPVSVFNDRTRSPTTGYAASIEMRIAGLSRKSRTILSIRGDITATLASGMLLYSFDATRKADERMLDGVKVTMDATRQSGFASFKMTSHYPKGFPLFESYEEGLWQKNNALTLIAPDGTRHSTTNVESSGTTDGAVSVWRFADAKTGWKQGLETGWKVEFSTPSILREVPIRFGVSEIGLP